MMRMKETSTPSAEPNLQNMKVLLEENAALRRRVEWFERQFFGQKSEKRPVDHPLQHSLLGDLPVPTEPEGEQTEVTYTRGKAPKQRPEDCVNDSGLRFNDQVPVEVIELNAPELQGADADQYVVIGTKTTFRLAQRPASYVVLRYERPIVRRKDKPQPESSPAPDNVLDRSLSDVSLLAGMLVDKFQFHLPLYRQHQRMVAAGITVSRATLTHLVKRSIDLLRPIVAAQLISVLNSQVLAMDETPIKAGKAGKGKMSKGWFWPLYGDQDEIVFTFSKSRGRQQIENTLKQDFKGTLISDGYAAYTSYIEKNKEITHAQCWVHSRRKFIEAETEYPDRVKEALAMIATLYKEEERIEAQGLDETSKRERRLEKSKPVVDRFFEWCQQQLNLGDLLPSSPLRKALNYVISRETELRVFLEEPNVPLDTNHLERALRPIPMGHKNWLFCWTEVGAEHVGIIQSLICTCKQHKINPYTYLTDVLLRINQHPASQVEELTPRLWKEKFAENPLRSDLASQ